ncbi:DUF4190 domain-containing protein [Brevibacterium sp. SMBL_HHYL_HB1]|uniref:DUF4190 domain-containing protein n=1 Tax=Brevibacterium sp. SMBL_HHYL_HB1 TaxID=2777556 RepID=UPI001BAC6774|nr:DUF4190 domain-containing protein [Brevibacterium sp. SMBL_HHYL_HB1]QUL80328.1 DUF4190 domain-containing protein [Brevibacterium sp. SMBL_HHYL_HB1]
MSTPQNPDGSSDGSPGPHSNGQNPNNQPPSAPDYGSDPNAGQQPPQYGSQPGGQQYGSQQPFGASSGQDQPYGSQPSQPYGSQPGQNQNPYGQGQDPYGQGQYDANQYGQNPYDPNAQGYDPNQYGQQPAYAADGSSDQFIPANPNAAYGQFPAGTGGNTSKNLWGILALIGGIAGVLTSGLLFGGLLGIAAVVFGFIALSAIKKGLASNKGMSITGLILGFVAVLFTIVALIIYMFLGVGFLSAVESAASSQSPSSDPVDPSQGADGGQAAPAQGSEVTIGDDVTATVQVRPGTASGHASGAESSDGDIAVVTMTVKNDSSSDIEMTLANMEATDSSGQDYDDVFDGSQYKGSLAFTDPVPAGGETTYELAFGVPADEVDGMHIKLTLPEDLGNGKDFEFSKQ